MRKARYLVLLLCMAFGANAQVKGVKHVILIGMDGLGAYAMEKADNPVMKQMMAGGSWTLKARSVLPSSSAVNWASMSVGSPRKNTSGSAMKSR